MEKLILIKLGGSLITNKSKAFTAREEIIKRLAREIKAAGKKFSGKIIVGHGSGSFGHVVATKYQTQKGIINPKSVEGLAVVQDVAAQINRIVIKDFLKVGLPVFSLSPSSFLTARSQKPNKFFLDPVLNLLELGLIPVIYGDVILDLKKGCCIFSAEVTLNILAEKLKEQFGIIKIIHCGITDGVCDQCRRTVSEIDFYSFKKLEEFIRGSAATDVTGGMLHKVKECLRIARLGIPSQIINGLKVNNLKKAILGQKMKGTLIKG